MRGWARWFIMTGLWLVVFAVVVAQSLIILFFQLPVTTAISVYLGILAGDLIAVLLACQWWDHKR